MAGRKRDAIRAGAGSRLVLIQRTAHPQLSGAIEWLGRTLRQYIRPRIGTGRTGTPAGRIPGSNRTQGTAWTEGIADCVVVIWIGTEIAHVLSVGRNRRRHDKEKDQQPHDALLQADSGSLVDPGFSLMFARQNDAADGVYH